MINIRQSLSIDIAQNTVENLLRELNRHQDISLYRALQFPEVLRWFDEILCFAEEIEKLTFYKEQKEREWFLDISHRFGTTEASSVTDRVEEIILPFAPYWTEDFKNRLNGVLEESSTITEVKLIEIVLDYAKSIVEKSGKKLSMVFGPMTPDQISATEYLIIFQKAIFLLSKDNKETILLDQTPIHSIFQKYQQGKSAKKISNLFYQQIFRSGLIEKFYFLTELEISCEASLERELLASSNFTVQNLPKDFTENFWIKFLHQKATK
jgi:hypothetical protein